MLYLLAIRPKDLLFFKWNRDFFSQQRTLSISNYQARLKPNLKASAKKLQMRINPSSSPDDDSKFQINNGIALPKQDGLRENPSHGPIIKWNIHINASSQTHLHHCRQKHFTFNNSWKLSVLHVAHYHRIEHKLREKNLNEEDIFLHTLLKKHQLLRKKKSTDNVKNKAWTMWLL